MTTLTIIEWICRVVLATAFLAACGFFGVALFHAISTNQNDEDS